jgi:hypothetical protein
MEIRTVHRTMFRLLMMAGLLMLCLSASADVLQLSNGGRFLGSLDELTFLVEGKPAEFGHGKVSAIQLSKGGKDILRLRDGGRHEGELLSVKFRTAGGVLTFSRVKIAGLTITDDFIAKARGELAQREAKLDAFDGVAMFKLAKWCLDNDLKIDAARLARASLKANPYHNSADDAHKLLGHVPLNGEWVSKTEAEKWKHTLAGRPPVGAKKPEDPDEPEQPKPKMTNERVAAIKLALAKSQELRDEFYEKARALASEKAAAVKEKYGSTWDQYTSEARTLFKSVRAKEKVRKEYLKKYGVYGSEIVKGYVLKKKLSRADAKIALASNSAAKSKLNKKVGYRSGDKYVKSPKGRGYTYLAHPIGTSKSTTVKGRRTTRWIPYDDKMDDAKDKLRKAVRRRSKAAAYIKRAMSTVNTYGHRLRERVRNTYYRNQRILLAGKLMSGDELTRSYEASLE